MMCMNLYTILVLFAHFVIQFPKIAVTADDIFSIISDTVLERQTEYEFDNSEAIKIHPGSPDTVRLNGMFRQYLFLVTEEMDKRSRSKSENTSTTGINLHLSTVYIDIFDKDNVKFHHITCDVSQFEKLSQETQIIINNQNTSSFVNRYRGTMPWFTFTGLVEINDVDYNFTFNFTGPVLREEYEVAQNNEGNMKIKSKLEVFTFDDFILGVMNHGTNNDKTYEVNTPTLQQLSRRSVETTTSSNADSSMNNSLVIENATVAVYNPTSTSKSVLQAQNIFEQIHTPNAKLLGTLADTWLINIVDYLNEKYVKSRISAGNEPFMRIRKINLLEELCNNLIPNTIDISDFNVSNNILESDSNYRSYEFLQVRFDNLRKSVKCNGFDYSLKTIKESRCPEIDSLAKHNITFIYEYSSETEYRSQLNWTIVKRGRDNSQSYDCRYYGRNCYTSDSEIQINFDPIYFIIIELSIQTKENRQPIDDPVKVSVEFNLNPSNLKNVTQNSYRDRLLPHVHDELIKIVKSRVKF